MSESLDRVYLQEALGELGLMRAWKTFGSMAVEHLGLPAAQMPFYDSRFSRRGTRLLGIMIEMGNFGVVRKQERKRRFGAAFLGRKLGSLLGAFGHFLEMLALFPGHSVRVFWHTIVSSMSRTVHLPFEGLSYWYKKNSEKQGNHN